MPMRTIALRFGETFSPDCGTIAAHQSIIDALGYVWYGKLGASVSAKVIEEMQQNEDPMFLLIRSGRNKRYWVHFREVSTEQPMPSEYPQYYGERAYSMKTWFKVTSFEPAAKDVMSHCFVASSGKSLSEASRYSMSPYFIIDYKEDE